MKTFKHSGAFGDLLYSMALVKQQGGGAFYLHLDQLNWIGHHFYGSPPVPFHQGRMTQGDFDYMESFMLAQEYITSFEVLDPQVHAITHNLDRFRTSFVGHPGNYVDIYGTSFGLHPAMIDEMRTNPWLTVPTPNPVRPVVIARSTRWLPGGPGAQWDKWREEGMESKAVFVGLPEEYTAFCDATLWDIPWYATDTMLEVASVIAGADLFIGNQSQSLALAIGLGKPFFCEARQDLPLARNECYFPNQPGGNYF